MKIKTGYDIDQLRESMVKILDSSEQYIVGSGFIIRSDGYIVTCHHVIYPLNQLRVEYQGQVYDAQWYEELSNPDVDIAILKIDVVDAKAVPIINPEEPSTSLIIYGYPRSKKKNFPDGFDVHAQIIERSAPINTISTYSGHQTSFDNAWNKLPEHKSSFLSHRIGVKVDPGTSGGAVFAKDSGGVVGVAQSSRTSGISYVIRWDNIIDSLDQLGLEPRKKAVCKFLEDIEDCFKDIRLFHSPQQIILQDQYIPIEVTLERKYRHEVETTWGYAESDEELKRAYTLKGTYKESEPGQLPWEEAKKQAQRIMVLADPGMGKSTLLRIEALSAAREEKMKLFKNEKTIDEVIFPVFLKLSDLSKNEEEILDTIPALIRRDYRKTSESILPLLEEKLRTGKCLLLLDALDEVPKEHRNSLSEKINRFVKDAPCPVICTSRIVGYAGTFLDGAREVEIVPFSRKQTEQYIKTWFTNAAISIQDDSVSAIGLLQELRHKPQIRGLTQNPLLLSLLCSLYQEKKLMLPSRRCQIYEKAVDYMLSDWSRTRKPQSEGRIKAKLRLLEELAYQFTCQSQEIFSLDELYDKIESYLQSESVSTVFRNSNTDKLITELSEDDGLLQKLDRGSDRYLFLHRTFQEYLTASYLNRAIQKDQKNGLAVTEEHFWDYDWHETLTLLAGQMKDPIPLLKAITDKKDDIFSSLLLLAGRSIAECEKSTHSLISEIFEKIYKLWKSFPFLGFIDSTVVALGQTHSQISRKLQDALRSENHRVRGNAAYVLEKIGSESAVEALIQALSDEDSYVRRHAVYALGKIGSGSAIEALIQALNDEDSGVRGSAANALGEIGTLETFVHIIKFPKVDIYDPEVFSLARKLAIRFSKEKTPFVPVYPELLDKFKKRIRH